MSELYSVTVEAVVNSSITFRVVTVHPDAGRPPTEATFPMNLLVDLWALFDRGYASLVTNCALSDEAAIATARNPKWEATLRGLKDLSHGVDAPITEAEYDALGAGDPLPARFAGKQAGGWGMSDGKYHVNLNGNPDEFRAACAELVASYTQDELKNQGAYDAWPEWPEPATDAARAAHHEKKPSARLVLTLRDAKLLGFAKPGMGFDTAAYF